jgi:hypothetical protein
MIGNIQNDYRILIFNFFHHQKKLKNPVIPSRGIGTA